MTVKFDVKDLAHELGRLVGHARLHKLVVVLPLAPGMAGVAREFLAEGPPFDLQRIDVQTHEVFLTEDEAIFVFGIPHGPSTLEKILSEEDFWSVVSSWERIAADKPRFAQVAYDWTAERR